MTVKKNTLVWMALAVMTIASCRDYEEDRMEATVTLSPAIASCVETVINTRATVTVNEAPTGTTYQDDETLNGLSKGVTIRVFSTPTQSGQLGQANQFTGSFRYSNGRWHSSAMATSGLDYNLYAISPATLPGASSQIFSWGVINNAFDQTKADLSFENINIITDTDPMANIAAAGKHTMIVNDVEKQVDEEAHDNVPAVTSTLVVPTLTKRNYSIGNVIMPGDNDQVNAYKVWIAMDHLYAKATMYFAVDAKYNSVRTIRIKDAKIVLNKTSSSYNGNHKYSYYKSEFELDNTENGQFGSGNNTNNIEIDLIRGRTATENRLTNEDYVTLTSPTGEPNSYDGYKEFAWFCFLPISCIPQSKQEDYPEAKLVVNYDVYDNDNHPVRLNQTTENRFALDNFYRDDYIDHTPKPGENFRIKILVKPSYLYQLIDDDGKMDLIIENH